MHQEHSEESNLIRSYSQHRYKKVIALDMFLSKGVSLKEGQHKIKKEPIGCINPKYRFYGQIRPSRSSKQAERDKKSEEAERVNLRVELKKKVSLKDEDSLLPLQGSHDLRRKKWKTELIRQRGSILHCYIEQLIEQNKELEKAVTTPKQEKVFSVKAIPTI